MVPFCHERAEPLIGHVARRPSIRQFSSRATHLLDAMTDTPRSTSDAARQDTRHSENTIVVQRLHHVAARTADCRSNFQADIGWLYIYVVCALH
jgi:hypothetical protein